MRLISMVIDIKRNWNKNDWQIIRATEKKIVSMEEKMKIHCSWDKSPDVCLVSLLGINSDTFYGSNSLSRRINSKGIFTPALGPVLRLLKTFWVGFFCKIMKRQWIRYRIDFPWMLTFWEIRFSTIRQLTDECRPDTCFLPPIFAFFPIYNLSFIL